VLNFNCSTGINANAIFRDGGASAFSGSFLMQPGTYLVQFYANLQGCGIVTATTDNSPGPIWVTSGTNQCPGNPIGIMGSSAILVFGLNQLLQFIPSGNLLFGQGTLIFTKLQ
jgi:hypothetical protein